MQHLAIKVRSASTWATLFDSDLTLHHFIPLVRHITRTLEEVAGPEALVGYRAIVTPQYGRAPSINDYVREDFKPRADRLAHPDTGEVLRISEQDLVQLTYLDELEAFYRIGSTLCETCPERRRCPGSGHNPLEPLGDWIVLDPAAPRSNERIDCFTMRIIGRDGERILERDYGISTLQFVISLVGEALLKVGRLSSTGNRAEIIARYEGQPQVDPIILALTSRSSPYTVPATVDDAPRQLVDWDSLEQGSPEVLTPSKDQAAVDANELDIKVLTTELEPLRSKEPPDPARLEAVGAGLDEQLPIYLHRGVLMSLHKIRLEARRELGGILVGEAFERPGDGRAWVEVVAALPACGERGKPKIGLDLQMLRQAEDQLSHDYPNHRPVGWFRFHLYRTVALYTTDKQHLIAADLTDPLALSREEAFTHRNFFPQPWHIGMVIDADNGQACFYRSKDGSFTACTGYMLVD